ncbi:MAG TPA: hypothetical protein VGH99_13850 [Pseudonocardia sp.]|jgi:hypothetical protein
MISTSSGYKAVCVRATLMMADGGLDDFAAVVLPTRTIARTPTSRRPAGAGARRRSTPPRCGSDGKIIEHWANRDDLGTAVQLGWTPPSPVYLTRMLLALRRARRDAIR